MPKCPILGCMNKIGERQVMCKTHWFKVPKHLRDAVWNEYRLDRGGEEHRAVLFQAIRHVQDLESKARAGHDGAA